MDGPAVAELVADVAAAVSQRAAAVSADVYEVILREIPELRDDKTVLTLLASSVHSNVGTCLQVMQHQIDLSAVQAPAAALEYARRRAQRGTSLTALLRAYRLGHACFSDWFLKELAQQTDDAQMITAATLNMSKIVAGYVDQTSEEIVAAYTHERENWLRNRSTARAARIRDLLSGVERIDLYQMHWPPSDGVPVEEYWQVFTDLKREGKIRAAGLSNHDICQLEAAESVGNVDAIRPPFNLIHRDAADDVFLWAREHESGVIVYSPMASGLLTGAFSAERAASLEPGDWRHGHPDFTAPALPANLALAAALRPIAGRHGVTPAAIAVAWTLCFPGVTGAIVGTRSPRQVDGWLPAANLELKEDDLADITAAVRATGAGTGPASPPPVTASPGSGAPA